jgi:WD40 repeat protein
MSESSVPKITVNSILQLSVDSFEEKFINNKSETVYTINIRNLYNNKKWSLEKVYHDVEILHQELSKLLPQIPPFSSFSLFKSSRSFNTIVERKEEINEFLNECISRKDILSNKTFYEFIKMDKNFPEYIYNSPELIDIIENDSLCLNDLQYLPDENIIIGLLSNYNITKMVDSFIKNTEVLKWNKEELSAKDLSENDLHNPSANTNSAGAFCVYRVVTFKNKKNLLKVKLEKVFIKYFNDLTGSLFYDKKTNLFLIGFNSGKIIFYKVLPESVFTQFDYMADLKYHSSKISGIALNNMTNNFYTCGNDGKFCQGVVNLIYRENYSPELIHQNSAGYSYMYFDKKNERIYLSTYNGHLEVYLTSTEIASFISDINTSNHKYSLNDLYPYDIKNYLFSCSDLGNISVFDLCKPGQEKTTKELSYFNYYDSKFKIKSVIYDPETNEVITGDNYGRLIFWNLKYGKPIHVTKVNQNGKGICKIRFIDNSEEPNKILLVSCLDNTIYFVKLPLKWVDNEDIEKYEQVEIKVRSDLNAMIKIQDFLAKDEDYNSDEDSLNGWDYFANDAKEEQDKLKNKKKS